MLRSGKQPCKSKIKGLTYKNHGCVKFWLVIKEGKDATNALCAKMLYEGNEASEAVDEGRTGPLGLWEVMPDWLCGQPRESADCLKATNVADPALGPHLGLSHTY